MATIRKLPSGKYNVQVRREGHPPLSSTFAKRTEAKAWATKIEGDIDHSRHYGFSRVRTLADGIDAFTRVKATIKTVEDRDRHLAWWREHFGDRKLFHFTADAVEQARELRASENIELNAKKPARQRSPQTVRHYLMSLSSCLDYLKRKKRWIENNPVSDIDAPPVSPGRIRWLSDDERVRLLEACDASGNPDLQLVVRFRARVRRAAVGNHAAAVANARPVARVRIPADIEDRRTSRDAATRRGRGSAPRTCEGSQHRQRPRVPLSRGPEPAAQHPPGMGRRAEVRDFRFHDLRHTAATEMLRAGVDSRIVATVLGHRSMNMMRRYAHVAPELVVSAAKRAQR